MIRMNDTASAVLKQIGPVAAVLLGMMYMYFNPTQETQFNSNLMARLAETEKKADFCLNESAKLRQELDEVSFKFTLFKMGQDSLPFPTWQKDATGKIVFANAAYERMFLAPRGYSLSDYIGHNDYAVWDKETADAFTANDNYVLETGRIIEVQEPIDQPEGGAKLRRVFKYPIKINGVSFGTGGLVIPSSKIATE